MSRSRARLAADWFAKLRQNAVTNAVEHTDVTDVSSVSDSAVKLNDSPTFVDGTLTGALTLGTWTITDTGGVLTFSSGSGAKFSITAAGDITAADNVTAYGTP
tara:strand:+ start:2159 stop:2467 length:309 start_codon:yes stop_codon:yes gene_type:complete